MNPAKAIEVLAALLERQNELLEQLLAELKDHKRSVKAGSSKWLA